VIGEDAEGEEGVLDSQLIPKRVVNEIFEYRERIWGECPRTTKRDVSDIITIAVRSSTQMTQHIRKQALVSGFSERDYIFQSLALVNM
jgi:hypothetical protein